MDGRRMEVSPRRSHALRAFDEPFDLVVVGGGVNGCGAAWDAALRGMRVLLVERDDIGSGTSSWSSRLIHGGLKYLEKLDVKLVRESLREREWLLSAAPHLVRPLRMILPFYSGGKHNPLMLEAGMLAYDALSWDKSLPRHSVWSKRETLRRVPGLDRDGLHGAAAYFDAQVELAERLCVEVALAARNAGATVVNHVSVERLDVRGGAVSGIEIEDKITGERRLVSASVVINTAGPWVDRVLRGLDEPRLIGGTKGSHFIVDSFPGAPSDALYYEAKSDGRPMMVLPWRGQFMIGSSDERFEGDLDRVGPSEKEIAYILRETNGILPQSNLSAEDLLWGYTGVRPLPYTPGGDEGDITRRHAFHDHAPRVEGLVSLVGGKLTTFRQVGEEAADLAMRKLGAGRRRCATRRLLLPGAGSMNLDRFTESFAEVSGLGHRAASRVAKLYGTRARGVAERAAASRDMREVLDEESGLTVAEVAFVMEEEFAESLTDVLARRTMVGIGPTMPEEIVERIAKAAARLARWSDERTDRELRGHRDRLERFRVTASTAAVE
ncbi:MAG: glycerol-3-phosphate dehydrogenase/oxidase [Rubrobacteraceae bacterium]